VGARQNKRGPILEEKGAREEKLRQDTSERRQKKPAGGDREEAGINYVPTD